MSDSRANSLEAALKALQAEQEQAKLGFQQDTSNLEHKATQFQNETAMLKRTVREKDDLIQQLQQENKKLHSQSEQDLLQAKNNAQTTQERLDQVLSECRQARVTCEAKDELLKEATRDLSDAKVAKDDAIKKLADSEMLVANLRSSYQTLQSQHRTCQNKIEEAERDASGKIAEATGLVKKYLEDLQRAKETMKDAEISLKEKTEEIARLQAEVARFKVTFSFTSMYNGPQLSLQANPNQTTPTPAPGSAQTWFSAPRQTLGSSRVTEEFRRAAEAESSHRTASGPRYRLGGVIPTSQVPWGNQRPSRFTKTGRRMRNEERANPDDSDSGDSDAGDNGAGGNRNDFRAGAGGEGHSESDSSDDGENGDDEMGERDDHVVRRKWERMGTKKKYTQKQQNINCSRLARGLVLACLGSKHLFETFARDQVDDQRLTNFLADPVAYGPKLRNSRLDKRGTSTQEMLDHNHWNQTLIHNLAEEAAYIYANCPDNRFGEEPEGGWHRLIRVRIQPILKTHLEALPRHPGEPLRDRIQRVATRYEKIKEYNKHNNILHSKYHIRASVSAIMTQALRERGDNEGEQMWLYCLNCLRRLEHDGMSDEEEAFETVVIDGKQSRMQVRKVMRLPWRHQSFRRLFEMIDQTREVEASIFSHQGRPPMKRIRVNEVLTQPRSPPKHLPPSFFDAQYLQELAKFPYQIEALRLSKTDFPLREVPNLPDFDEQ
ncbi:hypothetical protein VKT23_020060 [Stygiomarasmius scandens]|uniref:Uncharacterized protein n=1 Tax=Marasmiellus scandens TaxID=2682957 RepID=A0ABR1IJX6_9AGAR